MVWRKIVSVKRPPSLSEREALILHLLLEGHRYGLDLVSASDGALKRGTVYVTLERMEDQKGYVTSDLEVPPLGARGPQRRVYKITGLGRRVLAAHEAACAAFAKEPA